MPEIVTLTVLFYLASTIIVVTSIVAVIVSKVRTALESWRTRVELRVWWSKGTRVDLGNGYCRWTRGEFEILAPVGVVPCGYGHYVGRQMS